MLDKYTDEEVREIWLDTYRASVRYIRNNLLERRELRKKFRVWGEEVEDIFEDRLPGVID